MKIRTFHFLLVVFIGFFSLKSNAQDPNWSVNPSNYQFSATYTTFLNVFGDNLNNTNDKVAAFVNGEIRGVGNLVYVASADKYVAYLTVYANTTGESINFKIYNSLSDTVYNAVQTDTFKVDKNVGSVFQSFAISNQNLNGSASLADINFKNVTPILKQFANIREADNSFTKTFIFLLPAGTNLSALIPELNITFKGTAFVGGKKQVSGVTVSDFTEPVVYQILSQDEKNIEEFTIEVSEATNTAITTTTITSQTAENIFPKEIDVQFSNPVSGFEKDDFNLTNAVISNFIKIDNQNYKIEVVPVSEGNFSIFVNSAVVVDADNRTNFASNTLDFQNDITSPIITNLELKNVNGNEHFEIVFNEEVLNVDISDFHLTGILSEEYFLSSIQRILPTIYRLNVFRINNNSRQGSIFLKIKSTSNITDVIGNKILPQEVASFYKDIVPPIIPTLPDITAACSVTISEIPKTQDAVSGEIVATTTDPLTYTEQGDYTITWTFSDESGNSVSVPQNIYIKDDQAPQIPFLNDLRDACAVNVIPPIGNDNCAGNITATTIDPLFYDKKGNYTINWVFSDGNGNTTTAQQNIIVEDFEAPVAPVLPDVRSLTPVTLTPPQTTDTCTGLVTGTTTDPVFYDKVGQYMVRWVFDDGNNNVVSVDQNVFIFDGNPTPPVLPNLVGDCAVNVLEAPKANSINGEITGTTTDPLTYTQQGEFTITWSFDFGNGTILQSQQKVIVKDNVAPELPFLNDIIAECSLTITAIPKAFDFCTGEITASTTDPLSYNQAGEYKVNWNFDDGNGNVATTTQTIIITDTTPPSAVVLPDVNAQCSVELIKPTTTDNCAGIIEGSTTDPMSYNEQGTYIVTWIFDDGNGNKTSALQNVIIQNTATPTAPTLPNLIGECAVLVTTIPEADGNACLGKITGTTSDPLNYLAQGEYTITWNFDYGNGTILQSKQKVIVKDETNPVALVNNEIELELDDTGNALLTIEAVNKGSTDNCEIDLMQLSKTNFTNEDLGENTVEFTVFDKAGNKTTVNVKVTLVDKILSTQIQNLNSLISVYPNPIQNRIFIKNDSKIEILKIEIFTVNGKRVLIEKGSAAFIDVSNLSIGLYFLKIESSMGILIKKLLKKSNQ